MGKFITTLIIIGLVVMVYVYVVMPSDEPVAISSFDECVAAGNPIAESYPPKCFTEDGQSFTQDIGNELEMQDLIRIDNPRPTQLIFSPLKIQGQARGYWFFEGDFPVNLLDEDGNLIVQHYASAKDNWMTEEFVPFEAKIEFEILATSKGVLILEKDNPSGLPENDDQLRVPVRFE